MLTSQVNRRCVKGQAIYKGYMHGSRGGRGVQNRVKILYFNHNFKVDLQYLVLLVKFQSKYNKIVLNKLYLLVRFFLSKVHQFSLTSAIMIMSAFIIMFVFYFVFYVFMLFLICETVSLCSTSLTFV